MVSACTVRGAAADTDACCILRGIVHGRMQAYGFYATWTLRLVGTDMDAYATKFRAINLPRDTS